MNNKIIKHYLEFSTFTNPGCYLDFLKSLPGTLEDIGLLLRKQIIHRTTLQAGNIGTNKDLKYGDMTKFPWWRLRCDDDVLLTANAMIAELLRLNDKFYLDRKVEDKIIVTCRYVSVLMASILKSKGISTRVRSGFAPYFAENYSDHWINQYWNNKKNRWITIDVDGSLAKLDFNPYDIPNEEFYFASEAWLGIRQRTLKANKFVYAGGLNGLEASIRAIFYDFHSLMNNEITYTFQPSYVANKFTTLKETDLKEIDKLAELMMEPDKNFNALIETWENNKKFRILNSPLTDDSDH